MNPLIQEAIDQLESFKEEDDVSKKFKEKTDIVISMLKSTEQLSIEKALSQLEELNSIELNSFYRAQIWSIVSTLESIKK